MKSVSSLQGLTLANPGYPEPSLLDGPLQGAIMEYRVRMVQVNETDGTRVHAGMLGEQVHGGHHGWVWYLRKIPAGQLTSVIEGSIDVGHVNARKQARQQAGMLVPSIDVGYEQHRACWPTDPEGDRITELVPVWHVDRFHLESFDRFKDPAGCARLICRGGETLDELNVVHFYQLRPRAVVLEEEEHRRARIHRYIPGAGDFMAKVHQPGVVTDVCMGEENRINGLPCSSGDTCLLMEQGQLAVDAGRRLDEHEPIGLAIVYADARGSFDTSASPGLGAAVLFTTHVWQSTVLCPAQYVGIEACTLDVHWRCRTRGRTACQEEDNKK